MIQDIGILLMGNKLRICRSEGGGSRISSRVGGVAENPAPGWLHQRSISGPCNVAPSHAATGGTSGSSCGPGRDRSGEFPFSLLLMHISPENSSASDEGFFD